jgi:hypothetical protein
MIATLKKSTVINISVLIVAVLASEVASSYIADSILATVIMVLLIRQAEAKSSIHLMFLVGFSVFTYVPALVNGYLFETPFWLFYANAAISFVLLRFAYGLEYRPPTVVSRKYFRLFVASCIGVITISLISGGWAVLFLAPMTMFYALSLRQGEIKRNILTFSLFLAAFIFYYRIGWSGFGRTVTFGILLVGVLYLIYACGIKVSKFAFALIPAAGSLLLVGRKSIDEFSFSGAAEDSAIAPYRLVSSFLEMNETIGNNISGFIDQVLFVFFVWVPRAVWPSKPFGFGYQYVVDNLEAYADSGHSIASTLIGDHLYYLGWWGLATGALMAYAVARLCRFASSTKLFDGHGVVILACLMMVLVWGGMTSFSARLLSPLLTLSPLIVLHLLKRLLKSRRPRPRVVRSH